MDGLLQSPGGSGRQGGDRKAPPASPSRSPPPPRVLVLQSEFQDLTPCWSRAAEDLTHSDITLVSGPAPDSSTKRGLRPGPGPQSPDKPSRPLL